MKSLNYGEIPADLTIDEPYDIGCNASDETIVAGIVNQGIDSHLEAVHTNDRGLKDNHHHIEIADSASMRCFLRRCVESGDDETMDLASSIMTTLGYEWV